MREPSGGSGFCGMGTDPVVALAAPHLWEEPCISGVRGSGAVFFSGCTLGCAHCQNHRISHLRRGKRMSAGELADCFRRLADQGVHNLSLVTATHFLPAILSAFEIYRPPLPVVYNCGGYERPETIRLLDGVVDVYLPDIKHCSPRLSRLLSGAGDYFEKASAAVLEMCRQTGGPRYDPDGMMTRGTLVRHLVLPGCTGDSLRILEFIRHELPAGTPVSLMSQYTPQDRPLPKGLERRVSAREYARVLERMDALGLEGYRQGFGAADAAFLPDFDLS